MGLPAKEARDRGKGQLLRQQTGPFLESPRNDDALVRGQGGVAGEHMSLRRWMRTHLAGKREGAKATRDSDELMAVSVDRLRGKKTGGAAQSVQYR